MQYAPVHPVVGGGPVADIFTPDTTARFPAGMVLDAVDPYFGWGRFIYLQSSGAVALPGRVTTITDQTFATADAANTANLGQPVVFNRQVISATGVWSWYQMQGVLPVQVNATVAQGAAIGIAAAGILGTNTAGKQLLNAKVLQSQTFTLTKANGVIANGDFRLFLPGSINGLFVGLAVTGSVAGIAASSTIASIDPSGRFVTLNNACTATVTIPTVTFTYTGFGLLHVANAFLQGAIT
jgi:hypothetical protein